MLLGDARLTGIDPHLGMTHYDCCQKVFRLSHSTLMGFAGSVFPAADFLNTLPEIYKRLGEAEFNREFSIQQLVLRHTLGQSELAEAYRLPDGALPNIDFVFTGRAHPSIPVFQSLHFRLPDGHVDLLTQHGITVLGSGKEFFQPCADSLAKQMDEFRREAAGELDPAHYLASSIQSFVGSMLSFHSRRPGSALPSSVGTILHGMYVDENRITPLRCSVSTASYFGETTHAPFGGGYEVAYENERFVMRSKRGQVAVLMYPPEVISGRFLTPPLQVEP